MKTWKKIGKCLLALLLVVAMCIPLIQSTPASDVQASTDEFNFNGHFEEGKIGEDAPKWRLIPAKNDVTENSNSQLYLENSSIKTREESNGNKVGEFKKRGPGYMFMATQEIPVEKNTDYSMSFFYSIREVSMIDPNATTGNYQNDLYLAIVEIADDGSKTVEKIPQYNTSKLYDEPQPWKNVSKEFKTKSNTASLYICLWNGYGKNIEATIWVDNVQLKKGIDYNGDFESGMLGEDVPHWRKIPGTAALGENSNTSLYLNNFSVKTQQEASGNRVGEFQKISNGYMHMATREIPVTANADYRLSLDYSIREIAKINPSASSGNYQEDLFFIVTEVAEDGTKTVKKLGQSYSSYNYSEAQPWDSICYTFKAAATTKKVYVSCCMAYGNNIKATIWIDNVKLEQLDNEAIYNDTFDKVYHKKTRNTGVYQAATPTGWTLASTTDGGSLFNNGRPYTGSKHNNYVLGVANESDRGTVATVTREDCTTGGSGTIVLQSELIPVKPKDFCDFAADYKVLCYNADGSLNENGYITQGIGMTLAYYDSSQTLISEYVARKYTDDKTSLADTGTKTLTGTGNDWMRLNCNSVTIPENVSYVKVGLAFGMTSYNNQVGKKLVVSLDNASILVNKGSDVLFRQTAIFAGDEVAGKLSEEAKTYTWMATTDATQNGGTTKEQLAMHSNEPFAYTVIAGGKTEKSANMAAGTVTADNIKMSGVGTFDTNTYAGVLEDTFASVAECFAQTRPVYVLTVADDAYLQVAKKAAKKWNVELAVYDSEKDVAENWQTVVNVAEVAKLQNRYDVPGMLSYIAARVEAISSGSNKPSNVKQIQALHAVADMCPAEHADYSAYQSLLLRLTELAKGSDKFNPIMCGATIAINNPNKIRFIATAPAVQLASDVKVKTMGILIMPASYMDSQSEDYNPGAALRVGNECAQDLQAVYNGPSQEYVVVQDGWEISPNTEYVAQAYVIYNENGEDVVFYSTADYKNNVGTLTATGGTCIKSVYGVAKDVAKQLITAKGNELDYSAIGGENNIGFVDEAEEEGTTVTLHEVFYFVGDNIEIVKELIGEGGTAR